MNDADRAQSRVERFGQLNIAKMRSTKPAPAIGRCLFCGAALAGELRFCDVDCRDDFEREQQRKARG